MEDNRRIFSDNEKMVLFNEVDGRCPICGKSLTNKKNGKIIKIFEVAHIYPANPHPDEIELLKNEERMSEDVNSLDNVIAVCRICHKKFDTPRTIEEYQSWVRLKKKLIQDAQLKNSYALFNVENEIKEILKKLNDESLEVNLEKLSYDSLKIEQKVNNTLPFVIKRTIRNDVVDYFDFIHGIFIEMDKITPYKFDTLASQIKSFYCKIMQINPNQEFVYTSLVDWLNEKTESYSRRACEIVVAYFVQDCEVFS